MFALALHPALSDTDVTRRLLTLLVHVRRTGGIVFSPFRGTVVAGSEAGWQVAAAAADDILKRVPPQNLEAEQSVLGAILLDNEGINQALEILSANDFYPQPPPHIFLSMGTLS